MYSTMRFPTDKLRVRAHAESGELLGRKERGAYGAGSQQREGEQRNFFGHLPHTRNIMTYPAR